MARCHALTATDANAENHFLTALAGPVDRPLELARTQLLYGEWLRRVRRKVDARVQLEASLRAFDELGCGPWAARAKAELGASGATVPGAVRQDILAALTPQELQIAVLAGQGMSNRDIAAQLFLSPRVRSPTTSTRPTPNSASQPVPNFAPWSEKDDTSRGMHARWNLVRRPLLSRRSRIFRSR
ncbi:helix-turn-helix transcriptional regulator [Fodinicola feengrottensis]|uniref:helix-turn-helix transcriptional regulator n=1 Tax=Fodinicola feengrottensis TaxID=435914 RepID=UPI0024416372|nr:helix-turn-helix transcriptional regulator [Fodinicola feengrottensis]